MKLYSIVLTGLLAISNLSYSQGQPGGQGVPSRAEARPAATISSFVQGMKKFEGYFNFYYEEKTGKIYLEVDKLDKEFLYFSSLSTGVGNGGPERGQASSALAKFSKEGTKILLVEPVTNYRAVTANQDEIKAVESNFAKSVIFGFTPVATEGDKILIDLTPFILRDSQGVAPRLGVSQVSGQRGPARPAAAGGATFRMDETRSVVYMPNTKNFPKNTEFEAMVTFVSSGGGGGRGFGGGGGIAPDPSAVTVNMHQSFVELPEDGFQMRKFDPRSMSGAFTYMDFSTPMSEPMVKRTIRRHRLEKKDPNAAVSEAIKPIVYYLSRGVPEPVKKALIDGGAWWNQAFETAGFKNAFQVKELPEGADPMDIRYNVVNWITRSGSPARAFLRGHLT